MKDKNFKDGTLGSLDALFVRSATPANQDSSDKMLRFQFIELIVRVAKQKYRDKSIDQALTTLIDNNLKGKNYDEIVNEVSKFKREHMKLEELVKIFNKKANKESINKIVHDEE